MGGMQRLTLAFISAQHPGEELTLITSLSFPNRGIKEIVGLDACEKLVRLDLSNNNLSSLEGLALCANLKWLSVAGNGLQSLKGIESLSKLTVLNASHNELTSMDEVSLLMDLRALILNDNNLTSVCRLDRLTSLNALVLSHNPIRDLGRSLAKISSITKLSLSYCRLQTVGSSLKRSRALKELRLSHNQLMNLPLELEQNGKLQILDMGHNYLRQLSDIQVLSVLHELTNLNLQGNPVCEDKQYWDKIKGLLPNLQILDGHLLDKNQKHWKANKKSSKGTNSVGESQGNSIKDGNDTSKSLGFHKSKDYKNSVKKSKDENTEVKNNQKIDSDENKPFIDLISLSGNTMKPKIDEAAKGKKRNLEESSDIPSPKAKMDSSVVCILEGDKKGIEPRGKISKFGPMFLQKLTEIEIGTGGPSTWDTKPVESKLQPPTVNMSGLSQNIYPLSGSSYSRWRLKGSRTDE
eukprot:Gb_25981 [translate_table: standard]